MDQSKKVQVKTLSLVNVLLGVALGLLLIGAGYAAALITVKPKSATIPAKTVMAPNQQKVYEAVGIDGARVYILDEEDRIESVPQPTCPTKTSYKQQTTVNLSGVNYPVYCSKCPGTNTPPQCVAIHPNNKPANEEIQCVIVLSSEDENWVYQAPCRSKYGL